MQHDKQRLDAALVTLGLYATREQAQRALLAGEVDIGGRRDAKPGTRVMVTGAAGAPQLRLGARTVTVAVRTRAPFVSRGGQKLAAALDAFGVSVHDAIALDIGASTGGFTDCLLQRGARRVYAVDCGTGQLHARLRNDRRVICRERTNARHLTRAEVPEPPDIVVVDVSFISVRLLIPTITSLARNGTIVVVLVKPQFEVGREHVCRGGVVRDDAARQAAVADVCAAMNAAGWTVAGEIESPLRGPAGNREYLLAARM